MNTPPILYKYIKSDYALTVLQNLKLKLTPPVEFDDPFEFLMRSDDNIQRSTVKKMMKGRDFKRRLYDAIRAQGKPAGSFKDFKRTFAANREQYVEEATKNAQPRISAYVKGPFLTEISSRFAILCLSELRDSILMWSHYASGHTGIALGIEIQPHWNMLEVEYRHARVSMKLSLPEDPRSSEENAYRLAKTKSEYWAYEKEWRAISMLEKLGQEVRDGKVLYFATIQPEIVKEIILGLRFPNRQLAETKALCKSKFPQARLLQAALHENEFGLVMKQVE